MSPQDVHPLSEQFWAGFWPMFFGLGVLLAFVICFAMVAYDRGADIIGAWGDNRVKHIRAEAELEAAKARRILAERDATNAALNKAMVEHDLMLKERNNK